MKEKTYVISKIGTWKEKKHHYKTIEQAMKAFEKVMINNDIHIVNLYVETTFTDINGNKHITISQPIEHKSDLPTI